MEQLATALLGPHESVAPLIEFVVHRAGGNPFFLEQLVITLIENVSLVGAPGDYRCIKPFSGVAIPVSVAALISARVDLLPQASKAALEAAAVLGEPISIRAVAAMQQLDPTDARVHLAVAVGAGLLRPPDAAPEGFSDFRHALVESMMGRSKEGEPLQRWPRRASDDSFGYRMNDAHGFQCPVGSHIRRANPRDSLLDPGEENATWVQLHRLLRRGRPFRGIRKQTGTVGVGMFFMAIVADISRQFEFVKRVWIGTPNFGGLCGQAEEVQPLADFTHTTGGGYFFLPGRRTLGRIARGRYSSGNVACR